jgi:hypothetical protein
MSQRLAVEVSTLIIYLDDDGPYLSWVTHHHHGFVIDWLRPPTRRHPIAHRATCKKIRVAKSKKKTHWTTGRRLKACSEDLGKLLAWAEEASGHAADFCELCAPQQEPRQDEDTNHKRLTKLEKQVLEYVLEIAVIYLDNLDLSYELTVGDIADCLDKTAGQIAAAMFQLIAGGYLRLHPAITEQTDVRSEQRAFPTSKALRMEPAFEKMSEQEIEQELVGLGGEPE